MGLLLAHPLGLPASAAELVETGRFDWAGEGADFGGFSGIAVRAGGDGFHAVTDHGMLYRTAVDRDAGGRIQAIRTEWTGRLLDNFGKPVKGFTADAEALAPGPDGSLYMAFESYARIARISPPDLMPETLNDWDHFRDLWNNESFESLALRPDGTLLAILEQPVDGHYRTFTRGADGKWHDGPPLPGSGGGFGASDAAFGPDGRLYLLERKFDGYLSGFETRIRRLSLGPGGVAGDELLLATAAGDLGNMEGLGLWTDAEGRSRVTLISDNNFIPFQRTQVVEYVLQD